MNSPRKSQYVSMSIPELLAALRDHAQVGSQLHSEIQGALQARLATDLVDSIDKHERAASRLSNQLLWLNIILGAFTVLGTILAVVALLR